MDKLSQGPQKPQLESPQLYSQALAINENTSLLTVRKQKKEDFILALKPRLVEEPKLDSDSTEAKSESSSKSSVNKKRKLKELNETVVNRQEAVVDPIKLVEEKSFKEKEIDEMIKKYNSLIAEKKRVSKEKRKEAKKKKGRLRKLAEDDSEDQDDLSEELKLVTPSLTSEGTDQLNKIPV